MLSNAKVFNRPSENTVLHAIRQHFTVNGQAGIADPTGMFGRKLELVRRDDEGNPAKGVVAAGAPLSAELTVGVSVPLLAVAALVIMAFIKFWEANENE